MYLAWMPRVFPLPQDSAYLSRPTALLYSRRHCALSHFGLGNLVLGTMALDSSLRLSKMPLREVHVSRRSF